MGRFWLALLGIALVATSGCGPSGSAGGGADATRGATGARRIVMAFPRELDLRHDLPQGRQSVRPLVNPGLSGLDDHGVRQPRLGETVPTLENGLWQILPDGRMEMTWRIREGARWHDGVPFTTDDLLFTAAVGRDREVPGLGSILYDPVDQIVAMDERTLQVSWKEPSIYADRLFSFQTTLPLPRHRLEAQYLESKADFPRLTFWLYDYLGAGPVRVRSWDQSSIAILEANADYVLGRPNLDVIEIRFISDGNTLNATILAGAIDLVPGLGSIDRGLALQEGWRDGRVVFNFEGASWFSLAPQLLTPRPSVIGEPAVQTSAFPRDRSPGYGRYAAGRRGSRSPQLLWPR